MATTLLEERLLNYKDKKTKNLSLDEIFVSFYYDYGKGTDFKKLKLSEIYVKSKKGDKEIVRPISSYEEFKKLDKKDIYLEKTGQLSIQDILKDYASYPNRFEPFYESFNVQESYESTEELTQTKLEDKKQVVEKSFVPYGMSRTMKVEENELSSDNNYLMAILDGSSKQEFFKKSDIYYFDGARIVYLYENNKKINFKSVKGKTLYAKNKIIDRLYTEKEYTFGEYQNFDKLNADQLKRESYELLTNPTTEEKEKAKKADEVVELDGKYYIRTKSIQDDRYYSEHTRKVLTIADPKKPGKTKEEAYYAVKIYEVNKSGNFVQLRVKGGNKAEMVDVASLCDEAGNAIDKDQIKNFVGKSIKLKTDNGILLETEQLTFEQANYFYEKHFNYEPSVSKEDALAENAFLQTKDGQFIEEVNVRPIGYTFTEDDKCDAYLIKIETENGLQEKVVKADDFEKINNKYQVKAVYNLQISSFTNADVVQTTTNASTNQGAIEDCRVLHSYNAEKDMYEKLKQEQLDIEKKALLDQFEANYIDGKYVVDHVYIDGDKIYLDPRMKRFVYTDEHLMRDYASDTLSYSGLEKSNVTYESKDGKLGKFKGNAKLSFGKVCKQAYAIWAKSLVYYIGLTMTGAGMLACLAAPALVVAAAGAIAVAPVAIPIVAWVTCIAKNVLIRPFRDKTEYNRKKWNKDLEKELIAINNNMHDTNMTKGYKKDVFLAKMDKLKADILATSKSTVGNGFQVIDGKIVVDGENVREVKEFKDNNKKQLSDLKKRKSKLDKAKKIYEKSGKPFKEKEEQGLILNEDDPKYKEYLDAKRNYEDLQELYSKEESRFNSKMASHNSEAITKEKDPKVDNKLKRIERLKNFWLVKKFATQQELEDNFEPEEIQQLKNLEYDPSKDLFITKDGEYIADTLKPKVWLSSEASIIIPEAKEETVKLLTKLKNLMDKQNKQNEVEQPIVEEEEKDKEKGDDGEVKEKSKNPRQVSVKKLEKLLNNIERLKELHDIQTGADEEYDNAKVQAEIDKLMIQIKKDKSIINTIANLKKKKDPRFDRVAGYTKRISNAVKYLSDAQLFEGEDWTIRV